MSAVSQNPVVAASSLTGLARALVQQGELRPDRAESLARRAAQSNTLFIDELVAATEATGLKAGEIARFAAETFGHPLLDLTAVDTGQLPADVIDRKLVGSLRVLVWRIPEGTPLPDPPREAFLGRMKAFTNLRPVRDERQPNGYALRAEGLPDWTHPPGF